MDLKRGIDLAAKAVMADVEKQSKKIKTSSEILGGTVSANGESEIGSMIAEAMQRVGNEGVITVDQTLETELDVVEGCNSIGIPISIFHYKR